MKVSVVIPTLNEEKHLPKLLKSIQLQEYEDIEVIVANSPNSTDKTGDIAKDFGVKLIEGGILSVARNNGAKHSTGDILFFADADTEFPDKKFLRDCIDLFLKENLDLSSTLMIPDEESKRNFTAFTAVHFWCLLKKISGKLPKPFIESGGCMVCKKDVFIDVGGFREELPNGVPEDLDFTLRSIKKGYKYKVIKAKIMMSGRRFNKPIKAIKRMAAIATLGNLAMRTDLHKNKTYVKIYQKLYGDLGGDQ